MNAQLVQAWIVGAVYARMTKMQANSMVRTGRWGNTLGDVSAVANPNSGTDCGSRAVVDAPQVQMVVPLRQPEPKHIPPLMDENACVCGLVNCWEATRKISGHRDVGPAVAWVIDTFLDDNPELEEEVYKSIGSDDADSENISNQLDGLRQVIAKLLAKDGTVPDIGEVFLKFRI
jgi:hypothetical protein